MSLSFIPNSGQNLPQTRDPIRVNFQNIDANFALNHVTLNSGGNAGKHNFIEMPLYVAQPPAVGALPTTQPGERGIYCALSLQTPFTAAALFLQAENSSAAGVEITYALTGGNYSNGFTFLPSGVMLQWGTMAATNSFQNFPKAFTSNCFSVTFNAVNPGGQINILQLAAGTLTRFGCTINSNKTSGGPMNTTAIFFAIGI